MDALIKGKVVKYNDELRIDLKNKPKRLINRQPLTIINNNLYLQEGDDVDGYIIYYNADSYGFMVHNCKANRLKISAMLDILTITIANKINEQESIFGRAFDPIKAESILNGTTNRFVVLARRISVYFALNYFKKQMSDSELTRRFKRDRTSLYYMKYEVEELIRDDLQIKQMIEEIEDELNIIYTNLKEE